MGAGGLHPHQRELLDGVEAKFEAGRRAVVMQLATGGGKTHTAAERLRRLVAAGRRCVFLAHLDSLIEDTHERLVAAGVPAGFVQADRPTDPTAPVQVCSIATLQRRPHERPPADDVIIDECHRSMAAGVRDVLGAYVTARILGLTATPQRGDAQPLGDVFDDMVCGPSLAWLTERGFLVPCSVFAPPEPLDGKLWCDPVDALIRWSPRARAIIFAANVAHAEQLVARLGDRGRLLIGETPREERREIRRWIAAEPGRAIVNVAVAVEGFDAPSLDTVVLARAFEVTSGFLQAIGRGLRVSPDTGKTLCTVLDLRGAVNLHGLPADPRRWSLDGKAVVRTGEGLEALRRCAACLAVFPVARVCPRCGASGGNAIRKLPRVLNRAEKMERVSDLSLEERERRYVSAIVSRLTKRGRPRWLAEKIAAKALAKKRAAEASHA